MGRFSVGNLIFGAFWVLSSCWILAPARAHDVTHPAEASALRVIRGNLDDPRENLKSWRKGDPCSSNWVGVLCFDRVADDGYLHVRELQLLNMNLSGHLAPELGQLSHMEILDFMWNNISGSIPKEIGSITSLRLLLLNGNHLSGSLPAELGNLRNLDRMQIDENSISGVLPKSFANLELMKHFHMNNNSISGQIPPELSRLPYLQHFLLDNNNLSGYLPPEFSQMPNLLILQLDNNNFSGSSIPASYGNMTKLLKLSLRNCSLQGSIPDMSGMHKLNFLDLSHNLLSGSIPSFKVSTNITTIDFSDNILTGSIPAIFSGLLLQKLSLENNRLSGSVPSSIWDNIGFSANGSLLLNFQNNLLTNVSGALNLPFNVTLMLQGNPLCTDNSHLNMARLCGSQFKHQECGSSESLDDCKSQSCPTTQVFDHTPASPVACFCGAPIRVGYRLKSPGFSNFRPYMYSFKMYMANDLSLYHYQLYIDSCSWEVGPRLRMYLKLFPNNFPKFNASEIQRIRNMFSEWRIHNRDIFGPYELLNFTYGIDELESPSGLRKGTVIGIVLGAFFATVVFSSVVSLVIVKRHIRYQHRTSRRHSLSKMAVKVDGIECFTFGEMALATDNFSSSHQVGQGGYGKVYKGILADGTVVAIKRAMEGSLQGSKEFFTEIELLSRLHHRNLVSLLGFCDEEDEQMLVYEFMPNGTLRDNLSGKCKEPLNFPTRLRIALESARGILYLHTEADPPIIHRDIKASNILLDSKFIAKVADFGLSRLAPASDTEGTVQGHISTVVKGTPGYLDPEYFLTHKVTDKSDVYSLGVVFLELVTGMRPIVHGKNIVRVVTLAYQSGTTFSIIDNSMGSYPSVCVKKFLLLALRCCEDKMDLRPSMSEVVRELENVWCMTLESTPKESDRILTDYGSSLSLEGETPLLPSTSGTSGSEVHTGVTFSLSPR
uniref:non-specific serine/threonine protein kinase n=2 Tax=Anthurium amnicola TaxID=1678845 RepID=A0A1D1YQ17_9ARAE